MYKRAWGKAGAGWMLDLAAEQDVPQDIPQAKDSVCKDSSASPDTPAPLSPLSQSHASPDSVVRQGAAPISLQKDGVRVLLFRECDTRGRKLLYDSKTVVQVPLGDAAPHAASPAPKTLFKGSWGGAGGPSAQQHAQTKSPASARAQQKTETSYAEVSDGFGYQVRDSSYCFC